MSYEIRLDGLQKIYPDGTVAVAALDLVFPSGKTTAVVGPSGSGKSTVLKMIAGLIEPNAGRILFDERDVTYLAPEKRNIGMVFQSYALFPNLTVVENVEFGLKVRGVSAAERRRRAESTLNMVQIPELASRRIHQLSGGQQQRVALARALVIEPQILLFDEPLSALDAKIRIELRAELGQILKNSGITAVYVTHDQQEAMSLGDRVVVMDHGIVMQAATPAEIYHHPKNDFVARFIGNANLLPAVLDINGASVLDLAFCKLKLPKENSFQFSEAMSDGKVTVLCRPQDISISSTETAHTIMRIDSTLFLGDRISLTGTVETGQSLMVETHSARALNVGDMVPVRINAENIHILDRAKH